MAVEQGAAVASRYIEQAGDKLEQRYSGTDNPRQLDPKTKARCKSNSTAALVLLCCMRCLVVRYIRMLSAHWAAGPFTG